LVIGHIVDIIISDNNHDIFDSLLSKMILDFRFIGVSKVSFWRTCNDWVKSSLLDKGLIYHMEILRKYLTQIFGMYRCVILMVFSEIVYEQFRGKNSK